MIVTSIKKLDHKKSVIYIDYEKSFSLYNSEIKRFHLIENCQIEDNIYNEIMIDILPKRCMERALYILKESSKTESQIREKLRNNFYPSAIIDSVVSKLKGYHYIDDAQYCLDYIRYHIDKKSKLRIQYDLINKGISKYSFENAMAIINESISIHQSQNNLLTDQIEKICKSKDMSDPKGYQKMVNSLLRKGFRYDDIVKTYHSRTIH